MEMKSRKVKITFPREKEIHVRETDRRSRAQTSTGGSLDCLLMDLFFLTDFRASALLAFPSLAHPLLADHLSLGSDIDKAGHVSAPSSSAILSTKG